jgi:hypothetical protein
LDRANSLNCSAYILHTATSALFNKKLLLAIEDELTRIYFSRPRPYCLCQVHLKKPLATDWQGLLLFDVLWLLLFLTTICWSLVAGLSPEASQPASQPATIVVIGKSSL